MFQERRTLGAARLGAQLILFYLRWNIRNIFKNFYPNCKGLLPTFLFCFSFCMLPDSVQQPFDFCRKPCELMIGLLTKCRGQYPLCYLKCMSMCRHDDTLSKPKNCYLVESYDPGVVVVLESIFSFDLSILLNSLLEGYEEKALIVQGMKDPLSDSKAKLAMLKEHCAGHVIRELGAGHCPHDEQPEEVNFIIHECSASP
ncbi:hypothetical protein CRYUN_Cryun12cG0107300 [Craigia yunnanensis]